MQRFSILAVLWVSVQAIGAVFRLLKQKQNFGMKPDYPWQRIFAYPGLPMLPSPAGSFLFPAVISTHFAEPGFAGPDAPSPGLSNMCKWI